MSGEFGLRTVREREAALAGLQLTGRACRRRRGSVTHLTPSNTKEFSEEIASRLLQGD